MMRRSTPALSNVRHEQKIRAKPHPRPCNFVRLTPSVPAGAHCTPMDTSMFKESAAQMSLLDQLVLKQCVPAPRLPQPQSTWAHFTENDLVAPISSSATTVHLIDGQPREVRPNHSERLLTLLTFHPGVEAWRRLHRRKFHVDASQLNDWCKRCSAHSGPCSPPSMLLLLRICSESALPSRRIPSHPRQQVPPHRSELRFSQQGDWSQSQICIMLAWCARRVE